MLSACECCLLCCVINKCVLLWQTERDRDTEREIEGDWLGENCGIERPTVGRGTLSEDR